ncbi:MAG: hypothetical protein QM831_34175 [Kofleriaceae bacterium]
MKWLMIFLFACTPQPARKLPSASRSPAATVRMATKACGFDVEFNNQAYASYSYSYDDLGRLSGGSGDQGDVFTYDYDHLDHLTHYTDRISTYTSEQDSSYDTLGQLVDLYIAQRGGGNDNTEHYVYGAFTPTGQPTTEDITQNGFKARYLLSYDATDRLVTATLAGGDTTTYTYDDDGRTLTIDTENGGFHGVITYDDRARELSEVWGGTDPQADPRSTTYVYAGDDLQSVTYVTTDSTEVDTMKYRCP